MDLKKIFQYGIKTPTQRVGFLILIIGLISLFSWTFKMNLSFEELFDTYYFPSNRDSFFFHLYFYLIPLGLLMSWGYELLKSIKLWVSTGSIPTIKLPSGKSVRSAHNSENLKNLHFKNNLAAFEFATTIFKANFLPGQMSLGIIQDVLISKDGNQFFLVQLADENQTTLVYGMNLKYYNLLTRGCLVYWGFMEQVTDDNHNGIDTIGTILATLQPEFNPNNSKWEIKKNLTK